MKKVKHICKWEFRCVALSKYFYDEYYGCDCGERLTNEKVTRILNQYEQQKSKKGVKK